MRFASGETIKAGAIGTLAVNIVGTVLSYALTVLLARLLDPAQFGVFAFVLSLALILVLPAQLGLPILVVREVASARKTQAWSRVRGMLAWAHRFVAVSSVAIAVMAALVFALVPPARGSADIATLTWGVVLVPLFGLIGLQGAILRGSFKYVAAQLPDRVVRQALQIGLLLALWAAGLAVTPSVAMAAGVVATAIALALAWITARRARNPAMAAAVAAPADKAWLGSAIMTGLASGLSVLLATTGTVILGFLAAPVEAGNYRIATQIALFGGLAYTTLASVLGARFALARDDPAELRRIGSIATLLATIASALCLVGFMVFGRWFLARMFGVDYYGAWWPTVLLLAAATVNAAMGFASAMLMAAGHERLALRAFAASAAVMLVAGIAGALLYGATGVAAASLVAGAVLNGLLWRSARRTLGVDTMLSLRLRAALRA